MYINIKLKCKIIQKSKIVGAVTKNRHAFVVSFMIRRQRQCCQLTFRYMNLSSQHLNTKVIESFVDKIFF